MTRRRVREAVIAAVQPAPNAALDADAVRSPLHKRTAVYKEPEIVSLRRQLPREEAGAITKRRRCEP